ncbi:mitochondrial carrier protein [Microthyrium microscopicum]|uniref:Mitochondrial glycine transporter n=1 Tax=Microthyrium microscopicum TaxID=703497 RepID=A0A6A6U6J1_9PEZI|nr:mitochondrial carrier protein [Microthyrium microscopicum]
MPENGDLSKTSALTRKSFHFGAGLLSGLTSSILLQPADLLKTRLQQSQHTTLLQTLRLIASSPHPVRTLWRGTLPSAIRTGAGSALYFGGLDWLRGAVLARPGFGVVPPNPDGGAGKPRLTHTANLLTGAFARAAAGFVMMPITVIKVRYESSLYAYTSIGSASRDIFSTGGWRGFFAGFGATAVRDAPYAGLYVLFYEAGKRRLHSLSGHTADADGGYLGSSAGINFTSGTIAAGAATAITNPFDAIKTRLQLQPTRYGNMVKACKMMVREEGWRCLFDGLGLRMARKGMSSALAWTVYEELVRRAEVRWLREDSIQEKARIV